MHLDESGTHADSPILVVAGYIAEPDAWVNFELEWKGILFDLNTYLQKDIRHLHMTRFVGNFGDYRALANRPLEKTKFLGRFMTCIKRHVLRSFAVTFKPADFNDLIPPDWTQAAGSPYTFGLRMCMFHVAEWVRTNTPKERILYIMERGNEFENEADTFIRLTIANERTKESLRYEGHVFVAKDDSPGSQAADLIAYETFRMMRATLTDANLRWHIPPGHFGPKHSIYWMDKKSIEDALFDGLKQSESGSDLPRAIATLEEAVRFLKGLR